MGVEGTSICSRGVTVLVGSPASELHSFWVASPNPIFLTKSITVSVWLWEMSPRSSKNTSVVLAGALALSTPSASPVLLSGSNSARTGHKQSSSFQQERSHLSTTMVNTHKFLEEKSPFTKSLPWVMVTSEFLFSPLQSLSIGIFM